MVLESLKIKNRSNYFWDDMVYLDDFNVKDLKVVIRESRIGADIYYIGYLVNKPEYDINSIHPLYLVAKRLLGCTEKIEGSSDRYLVVDEGNKEVMSDFDELWKFIEDKIDALVEKSDKITFCNADHKVKEWKKLTFSSDIDLPENVLIEIHTLTVVINCVVVKDGVRYPEIYLDECLYETVLV